jgi:hypothetical protein
MVIDEDSAMRWEYSFAPGHMTVWGTPEDMLAAVIAVQPRDLAPLLPIAFDDFVRGIK